MLFYGFCDGLNCAKIYGGFTDARVSLLNPSTGESKTFPSSPFELPKSVQNSPVYVTFGIGYNSTCDDYTIVRMAHEFGGHYRYEMKLYSLKNNSWRKIQDLPHPIFHAGSVCCFLNGAFHWFSYHTSYQDGLCVVVLLDISEEKYGEIQIPRLNCWE
ncbi:F-box protein CPR1-like [Capsicum chacoense]|uniref:F-box associated beta-propeller type 1 domain-containing protein n=1 Tax=Capsicum annuum TaxID=4072 RepID=A0A1U8G7X5_CAPAN|nr:F-box protein CPR1-like [Capsicum annuum]KAF3639825.1 hypothetical protein FXO38_22457 [Capsicum annuum]PHT74987.1 hypothetical protein T459_22264 [Capsicum annuum]